MNRQTYSPEASKKRISISTIPNLQHLTDKHFISLKNKAFERRPALKLILEQYGNLSLLEFAKLYNKPFTQSVPNERKSQFIDTFSTEVERLIGKEIAESCRNQLNVTYRVTTTDHHGPLSFPGMINSNIHEALPYLGGDQLVKNIIVLGCANVSFDNETFPRGLLFHSFKNNTLMNNQLVFYSRAVRPCPLIFYPSYKAENMENAKRRIKTWEREQTISTDVKEELEKIVTNIYADPDVLSSEYFSEQVTKINFKIWKQIMLAHPHAPNLIYIEQENLVNQLLLKYHLDKSTLINNILFTEKYHALLKKYFDGILRGFSIKEKIGTYLFWALPKGQRYRVQLWKKGNTLQTDDGTYKVELTPDGIRNALLNKELIPSTLISFILLSFYYGVDLIGGTNQTTYLSQMKEAFSLMQKEYGDNESITFVKNIITTNLSVAIQSLAFLQTPHDARVPATGIDLILYGNNATVNIIKNIAESLTVKEAFYRALPDCYRWYYKEEERDQTLSQITKDTIEKYLQIEHKIIPSAKIK